MPRQSPAKNAAGSRTSRKRRWLGGIALSCVVALIYIVMLVVTMPASALGHFVSIPAQITALYGTVWQGRADLAGGYSASWNTRGGALLGLRGSVDFVLSGSDTQLTGVLTVTPAQLEARDVSGRAGPGLLTLVPGLSVESCTTMAAVDAVRVAVMRGQAAADGQIDVAAGSCTESNGRTTPVPPLAIVLDTAGTDARAQVTSEGDSLAEVIIAGDRRLILTLQPAGSAMIPGLPTGAPIMLEYPF